MIGISTQGYCFQITISVYNKVANFAGKPFPLSPLLIPPFPSSLLIYPIPSFFPSSFISSSFYPKFHSSSIIFHHFFPRGSSMPLPFQIHLRHYTGRTTRLIIGCADLPHRQGQNMCGRLTLPLSIWPPHGRQFKKSVRQFSTSFYPSS